MIARLRISARTSLCTLQRGQRLSTSSGRGTSAPEQPLSRKQLIDQDILYVRIYVRGTL